MSVDRIICLHHNHCTDGTCLFAIDKAGHTNKRMKYCSAIRILAVFMITIRISVAVTIREFNSSLELRGNFLF